MKTIKKIIKVFNKIIGALAIVLLLIAILVLIIGISIYDGTNNSDKSINDNPKDLIVLVNDYIENSLSDTKEIEEVDLLLTEYETNYILSSIKNEIKIPYLNIISMYAIFNSDSSIVFEAPVTFFNFKSCLKGNINIKYNSDGSLILDINSISIGKLSSSNFISRMIISSINFNKISKNLENIGIMVEISNNKGTISLSMDKEMIKDTINSIINNSEIENLVSAISEVTLGDSSLLSFKFNENYRLGLILYLKELIHNGDIKNDLYSGTKNIEKIKEDVSNLYKNGYIKIDDISVVFDYLIRGYESISDENKEKIDSIDFSIINISNKSLYQGIINRSVLTMAKIFLNATEFDLTNITNIIIKGCYDIEIKESSFNELLSSLSFIGTSIAFASEEYDISNITITSLYTEFYKESFMMYLVVDVNGIYINANISANTLNNDGAILSLKINELLLGNKEVNEDAKISLLKYLESILKDTNYIMIDSINETIILDFSSYIEGTFFEILKNHSFTKISITMDDNKLILRIENELLA